MPHKHPAPGVRKPEAPKLPPYSKSALQEKARKLRNQKPTPKGESPRLSDGGVVTGSGSGSQTREAASNISKGFGGK